MEQEEDAVYREFSSATAAGLNFFSMITVTVDEASPFATVKFGKSYEDTEADKTAARQIREYVKATRKWLRSQEVTPRLVRRKIFWFISKCIEQNIFNAREQGKIMMFAQFCFHESKEEEAEDESQEDSE
jgi:hypothetical protein